MKKVLLLAPMSSVHERFNIANINALRELNCEIHLAANFNSDVHSSSYGESMKKQGLIIHHIPFQRASLFRNLMCIPQVRSLIKYEKFDIVHCHTETGGILTRIASFSIKNTKYLYTPHGMSFYKGSSLKSQLIYKPIEWFICRGMNKVFAMNREEYETICGWNEESASFINGAGVDFTNIYNCSVDKIKKCKELNLNPDKSILLSIGELNDNKNHSTVLKAISQLSKEDRPQYVICGVGDNKTKLENMAKSYGISDNLFLLGYRYDIHDIINISDIFVFPSHHEGLSVALMQAMAGGLPVICSRIRGNIDLIEDNKGGFLLNPDSYIDFTRKLAFLLNNRDKCYEYGAYNKKRIENCSLSSVTDELKKMYSDVLGD